MQSYQWMKNENGSYSMVLASGEVFALITKTGKGWEALNINGNQMICRTLKLAKGLCHGSLVTVSAHR